MRTFNSASRTSIGLTDLRNEVLTGGRTETCMLKILGSGIIFR